MTRTHSLYILLFLLAVTLPACSGGAVVFAPTEAPPDLSPLVYRHPSGAFTLTVPRNWGIHEQNTTTLASAAFSRPGADEPALLVAVVAPAGVENDSQAFSNLIQQYQTQVRADVERYSEQDRSAMGDGSWRVTGLRRTAGGETEQVNTFIQRAGPLFAIMDVIVPDASERDEIQSVVNTFALHPDAPLQPSPLTTLNSASGTTLAALHVATWATADGVFFVTGEIANYGVTPVTGLPVQVTLRTSDGLNVAEASDTIMGHGIAPGGFAPFSLRFGQGQPAMSTGFELRLGAGWQPAEVALAGPEVLSWTDESVLEGGRLTVSGTVTNIGGQTVREPRAVATVFDVAQTVIAAGFAPADVDSLAPGETARYAVAIPEIGGQPANYIVYVQGLLD